MNNAVSSHKARAMVNQFDVSPFITKVSPIRAQKLSDCTTLADDSREYTPSLKEGTLNMDGLYRSSGVVTSLDDIFGALPDTSFVVSAYPEGRVAGKPAYLMLADEQNYNMDAVVGDLVKCQIAFMARARAIERGVSLHDLTAEVGTANGSAIDNGAATANGGVAHLHVTEITGAAPSITVKIQHSTNGSTWADLQSFAAITAAGFERIEIAAGTTVNQHRRVVVTFGGTTTSVTYNVSFAGR